MTSKRIAGCLKKYGLVFLFLFTARFAFAQTGSVKGTVSDSTEHKSLLHTTISLLSKKDSVLARFTRADKDGKFSLKPVQPGQYLVMTTHPLMGDYMDSLELKPGEELNLGIINLVPKSKLLAEVIVKSGSPIRIKGDTVVYTADSFKVKEGANVEDLLRKLPGITVGRNGEIKAMGESVKNVLVDGEEFFGNDPGMVTKNLQANAVQEVQVYDKKSDQAAFTGIDDGETEKTINLKLKANRKRGYFGKIEAGGGTPDNYNNSAMFNNFMNKRKLSLYGIMSNTGKTQLGWDEAERFGGGERDGMTTGVDELTGGMWMSWTSDDGFYNGQNGIPKNWNTGLHYSNKYRGDSLTINGSYRYSKINAPGGSNTYSQIFLPDSSWSSNSSSSIFSSTQKHNFSFTIENKIDTNNTIKFTNKASVSERDGFSRLYDENLTTAKTFINNSNRSNTVSNNGLTYNGVLTWNHKFKKPRRTLSATVIADINNSKSVTNLNSVNRFYKGGILLDSDTIDQRTNAHTNTDTYTASFVYTEPLDKYWSLGLNMSTTFSHNNNDRAVFTPDLNGSYTVKFDSLSNAFNFNRQLYKPGFVFRLNRKKITAMIGSSVGFNRFVQDNITRNTTQDYSFRNFFPVAGLRLNLKGNIKLNMNYTGNAQAPSLQQLQPVPDNSNPLSIYVGNSDLKQSFGHNITGNVGWNKPLSETGFWIFFSGTLVKNEFAQFNTIDSLGRNIYKTVNLNGNRSLRFGTDYYFPIGKGKKKINASIGPDFDLSRNLDYVNGLQNITSTSSYTLRFNLNKYVENKLEFYMGPSLTYNRSQSSINSNSNTAFWGFNGWMNITYFWKKKTEIGMSANVNYRERNERFPANNDYAKLNANIKRFLYKKELSLTFSVIDIFNQNRGYTNSFTSYKFTESYFNTLRRYWLLSLTWEFNHQQKTPQQK